MTFPKGKFERKDNGDELRFTYTDVDGDTLEVWRYRNHSLRMNVDSNDGVAVSPDDLDQFQAEIERLRTVPCAACNGKGGVRA